jgi:Tfp pilus assembly protein FimT
MNKTKNRIETGNRIMVSAETLAGMLDCGRATAVKVGCDAGAKVQVGRRTLYKVSVVERYLEGLAE